MPADDPHHDFLQYLLCDLPLGYPLKTPIAKLLSPAQKSASRRELLHQQSRLLDLAKPFVATHPWISYLAATKHDAVLVAIPTYPEQLVDIVDQLFFRELQQKNRELREASRGAIDEATTFWCDRLILLQCEAAQIEDARKKVAGAIHAGFTAVEPLPPPPPEPLSEQRFLPYFIGAGAACLVGSAFIPLEFGGIAWGLASVVVSWIVCARVMKKEKARVDAEGAKFKAYLIHENYLALCRKSVGLVLTLPFETRKSALIDLPSCLAGLEALPAEREALEARYIRSYISK